MIVLLSPAKTLDTSPSPIKKHTKPRLLERTETLVTILKQKSTADLQELMGVSEKIAQLNVDRYASFSLPFSIKQTKQASLMFKGDVYQGLQADTFDKEDLAFAQQYIRILSGLYGILRPLDLMHPYRLEMGTKLKNGEHKNLYNFWGAALTDLLNKDLKKSTSNTVLNLASKEYFKSIQPKSLKGQVVTVHFKEKRGEKLKVIAFNAKKARGAMAHQIVKYKIKEVNQLKDLEINGYLYQEELSDEKDLVFVKE